MIEFNPTTIWLDAVDSTNAEALRRSASGEAGPLWIAARRQLSGRGRRGRDWASSSGDLTVTLLLRPLAWRRSATPIEVATLSFAASLSISDAVRALEPTLSPGLKWPNDVLLKGGKLAGVLLESSQDVLAIGIGVNLAPRRGSAGGSATARDKSAPFTPLGLADAATQALSSAPEHFLEQLAISFRHRFDAWRRDGFPALREHWLAQAERLGEVVIARLPAETVEGRFVDLDRDGALLLETQHNVRRIHAADVFWRAAE
ncbi:MAG: biotin--[acetyl-CoA-carboxylase] ligase [Neomegalonema sp.]|nr:biotin--[acetyl-CoA-carboxylase] ligase [Neomegalonema sp.]